MRYILNSAVITAPGVYKYTKIGEDWAWAWLVSGPYVSAIGYAETAEALTKLMGRDIPANRIHVEMQPGDEALVFRLARRPGPDEKGQLTSDEIIQQAEFGLLVRVE